MQKNVKLPKESLRNGPDGGESVVKMEPLIDSNDVEGHGLPLTPPPSFGSQRTPGHGGENIPTPVDDDNDVEGHIK
jgi:hypothetical protein